MGDTPTTETDEEQRLEFLVEMTRRAYRANPGLPIPCVPKEGEEEIQMLPMADSEEDREGRGLAFEDDT